MEGSAAVVVICDLDGVIWLADQPIPGVAKAVERLREAGHRVLFVTNNSFATIAQVEEKLASFSIPANGDVVGSAVAAATMIEPGQRILLCGGPGVEEALLARGAELVTDGDADAVVVGFHRDFDWEEMRRSASAVRRGARLVATNDDATYPTPDGPVPGCGAILAGIAKAAGVAPEIAGKPYAPMAAVVRMVAGDLVGGVMVGDRPDTDGRFATALGVRFGLVLSGVTRPGDLPVRPDPDLVADDLDALVAKLLVA
jgi:4-nitrophenyl phosphatase